MSGLWAKSNRGAVEGVDTIDIHHRSLLGRETQRNIVLVVDNVVPVKGNLALDPT
jgi:hypothetical protein